MLAEINVASEVVYFFCINEGLVSVGCWIRNRFVRSGPRSII